MKLVWRSHVPQAGVSPGPSLATTPAFTSAVNSESDFQLNEKPEELDPTQTPDSATPEPNHKRTKSGSWFGWRIGSRANRAPAPQDVEKGGASYRPVRYFGPFYGGLALALSTCATSSFSEQFSMLNFHL